MNDIDEPVSPSILPSESPQVPEPTPSALTDPESSQAGEIIDEPDATHTVAASDLLIIDESDPYNSGSALLCLGMPFYSVYDTLLESGCLDVNTT